MLKKSLIALTILIPLLWLSGCQSSGAASPDQETVEVPANIRLSATLDQSLDSGTTQAGERFTMTVKEDVVVNEKVAIPAGAVVHGVVTEVESAGRPNKGGKLSLEPRELTVRGTRLPISGNIVSFRGEGSIKEDLKEIGIGSGIGAAIGALIDGGKGALIGLAIGGGGTFLSTKGEQVELPAETPLVIELNEPADIPV
ncbi:MAG TPA: hypothetical protein VLU25_16650 [Acidobacteriota bacterium]|nr:hypothetical protein [Acidobacteriota bacterium]